MGLSRPPTNRGRYVLQPGGCCRCNEIAQSLVVTSLAARGLNGPVVGVTGLHGGLGLEVSWCAQSINVQSLSHEYSR